MNTCRKTFPKNLSLKVKIWEGKKSTTRMDTEFLLHSCTPLTDSCHRTKPLICRERSVYSTLATIQSSKLL
jgi:hypothetical protein